MERNDVPGDALEGVARIHPAVDRLRQLLTSATILDLKATADGYWDHAPEGAAGSPSPEGGHTS